MRVSSDRLLRKPWLAHGDPVRGIDCFTSYYGRSQKEANLGRLSEDERFEFSEADLRTDELGPLVEGVYAVYHQAAQPGSG